MPQNGAKCRKTFAESCANPAAGPASLKIKKYIKQAKLSETKRD
jgi:hypothetical protein